LGVQVWSNDPATRAYDAFQNLRAKKAFEREQSEMFAHDIETCLRAVEEHAPRFFQPTGKPLGQRWHVTTCPGSLQWDRLDDDPEMMLKISRFYIEVTYLSAVDLAELRRGTGILTDYTGVSIWDTFAVVRVMRRLSELTAGPHHAVRLKSVCVLIPDGLVPIAHLGTA
jgi:hypothetical protein